MKDFCIVGSGVAGSTIANLLAKKYSIDILDKARGPGGRASNRRYKNKLSFDHGLQYISPKSNNFKKFIIKLNKKKILKEWTGNHLDFTFEKKKLLIKYIGTKGNNDICKNLLTNIEKKFNTHVKKIVFKKNYWEVSTINNTKFLYKNLVLTFPFPQMKNIAKRYINNKLKNLDVRMLPNITIMAVYKSKKIIPISSIKFNNRILGWASNENSKKRFNSNLNLWTIQTNYSWAQKNINKYKNNKLKTKNIILKEFCKLTGLNNKDKIFSSIHGWKYSYNKKQTKMQSYFSKKFKLGICGDWFLGPKAEHAWLSANDLFKKIRL